MKEKKIIAILLLLPLVLGASAFLPAHADPTATMYVDPAYKDGTLDIDDTFTLTIMFKDFVDLWVWQVQIGWDPLILDCTGFRYGPTLTDDVYDTLAPTQGTLPFDGGIDHVAGRVKAVSVSLKTPPSTGVTGAAGVGYKLVEMDMQVVGYGTSSIYFDAIPQKTFWSTTALVKQSCDFETGTIETTAPVAYGPTADFTSSPSEPENCTEITFDATASEAGWNGTHTCPITEYRWDFGDGNYTVVSVPTITHHYATPNTYGANLTVYAPGATPETDTLVKSIIVVPEFPMALILPILITSTLLAAFLGKTLLSKKHRECGIAE